LKALRPDKASTRVRARYPSGVEPTEAGKTTFLNFFATSLSLDNHGVFIASMEIRPETLLTRMYRATLASAGRTEKDTPVKVFLEECGPFISFADVFRYIDREQLLEMIFHDV
jgi:hypothetical protein